MDYARILTNAKAGRELKEYQGAKNAISLNKTISFGLAPVTAAALFGIQYKFPQKYIKQRQQVFLGVAGLTILTNIYAAIQGSKIPTLEATLIDKYVLDLPYEQLKRYERGIHKFPNAK